MLDTDALIDHLAWGCEGGIPRTTVPMDAVARRGELLGRPERRRASPQGVACECSPKRARGSRSCAWMPHFRASRPDGLSASCAVVHLEQFLRQKRGFALVRRRLNCGVSPDRR